MSALTLEECYANAARFKDRVVVITGAGSGFGRETSVTFAKYGAKLVLGDVDLKGLAGTAALVNDAHGAGTAVTAKCDVTSWDDQVALFALGHSTFGSIDIVLPNAGINEIGLMVDVSPPDDGPDRPTPPDLTTLNVDLIGVLYTTRLALYYFDRDDRAYPGLRAICFTASMSTFYGANYGVMYGASKAAILGIVKGIMDVCASIDVRAVMVAPYFTKTAILPADFVSPDPRKGLCRMEDVVGAFVASITDDKYNFGCWLIPDDKGVVRMDVTGSLVGGQGARRKNKAKL